jgi:hypothetical protein
MGVPGDGPVEDFSRSLTSEIAIHADYEPFDLTIAAAGRRKRSLPISFSRKTPIGLSDQTAVRAHPQI